MATDKLIKDGLFDWHYPKDRDDARNMIHEIEKYEKNPKNAFAQPFFDKIREAFELLIKIPLQ